VEKAVSQQQDMASQKTDSNTGEDVRAFLERRNTSLFSDRFPVNIGRYETYKIQGVVSGKINSSRKVLRRFLALCHDDEAIKAAEYIWNNPGQLTYVRDAKLGEGKNFFWPR